LPKNRKQEGSNSPNINTERGREEISIKKIILATRIIIINLTNMLKLVIQKQLKRYELFGETEKSFIFLK